MIEIAVITNNSVKASRSKTSGVLRFSSNRPDWHVTIVRTPGPIDYVFDGYVLIDQELGSIIPQLKKTRKPFVTLDIDLTRHPGCKQVTVDNAAIGRAAAALFLRGGFNHFATVRDVSGIDEYHSKGRNDAIAEVAEKHGATYDEYVPEDRSENYHESQSAAFRKWLAALPKPCALYAMNDRHIYEILSACHLEKIKVPEQIALLGADNDYDICESVRPTLSSVWIDFELGGFLAGRKLDRMLKGLDVEDTTYFRMRRPEIVERESTRTSFSGSDLVLRAMKLIEKPSSGKLDVAEIANRLSVTRRSLEMQFRKVLGHSPKEALLRERDRRILKLIDNPSLSVKEIAFRVGFKTSEQFSHYFHRRFATTPGEYRAKRW